VSTGPHPSSPEDEGVVGGNFARDQDNDSEHRDATFEEIFHLLHDSGIAAGEDRCARYCWAGVARGVPLAMGVERISFADRLLTPAAYRRGLRPGGR